MPLHLLPMPQSEWDIYYEICKAAFQPGIMEVMYPNGISEEDTNMSIASMRRGADRSPGRVLVYKVIDTDLPDDDQYQKVVGVSHWKLFDRERSEEDIEKEKQESRRDEEQYGSQPGLDMAMIEEFIGLTSTYKEKHVGRKPYLLLHILATRPGHGRRGIGAMSMQWGCDKADELGLPAYLEGSPDGQGLYRKWGFEEVDVLPFDARKWGYHSELRHLCMKRQPKAVGGR